MQQNSIMDIVYLFGSNTKEEVLAALNLKFECDFCAQTFQTQSERKSHTLLHFKQKRCGNCHTKLIQIGDDWYELHVSANCDMSFWAIDNDKGTSAERPIEQEIAGLFYEFPNEPLKINQSKVNQINANGDSRLSSLFSSAKLNTSITQQSNAVDDGIGYDGCRDYDNNEYEEIMKPIVTFSEKSADVSQIRKQRKKIHSIHRPRSNFTCDNCNKVLTTFHSLESHMMHIHYPEAVQKAVCKICNHSFTTKFQLKKHMFLHDTAKPFMCSYCAKGFIAKKEMLDHEKVHSGIKPYSCSICGRSFKGYSGFRHHMRVIHSDKRQFKCGIDDCKWSFKQKPVLVRHMARVHGIVKNRYPCPICSKEFPESKYHLKRHLKQAHQTNYTSDMAHPVD